MLIYRYTCLETNKSNIGQTRRDIMIRWREHCSDAKRGSDTNFHRAIRKHGTECWTHEILEEISDLNLLNEREIYWINYYNTFKNGYNSTAGGNQNIVISEETKNKMKISAKNRPKSAYNYGINHHNYGKSPSIETRLKQRNATLGKSKNKGKIYITNDIINKSIYPDQLEFFILNGFRRGRT